MLTSHVAVYSDVCQGTYHICSKNLIKKKKRYYVSLLAKKEHIIKLTWMIPVNYPDRNMLSSFQKTMKHCHNEHMVGMCFLRLGCCLNPMTYCVI